MENNWSAILTQIVYLVSFLFNKACLSMLEKQNLHHPFISQAEKGNNTLSTSTVMKSVFLISLK